MRYLSFDIECCDGQHICEFGYVLADESFAVLEKKCLLMDPARRFNLGNRYGGGITLSFSEREYAASPEFPHFYEQIKAILEEKEQRVIGFSVRDDVRYLAVACDRYGLKRYAFETYDSQQFFANLYNDGNRASLERSAEALGVPIDVALHKSDDDALLTLRLVKAMCADKGMNFNELWEAQLAAKRSCRSHVQSAPCTIGDLLAGALDPNAFEDTSADDRKPPKAQ